MARVIKTGGYFQNNITSTFHYKIHPSKILDVKVIILEATCDTILGDGFSMLSNFNVDGSGTVETNIDPTYTNSDRDAIVSLCHQFSLFSNETEVNFIEIHSIINIDLSYTNRVSSIDVAPADITETQTLHVKFDVTTYYCNIPNQKTLQKNFHQGRVSRFALNPTIAALCR